ncbi:unnamed protein product [Rhizophagus irregularis]|nr:unnamed protein product [Rhizophagus irregularis]
MNPEYYRIDKDNIEYLIRVTEFEKYKADSWFKKSISFIYEFISSDARGYSYYISARVYLYNATRPLLLSGWASEIKKCLAYFSYLSQTQNSSSKK